MNRKLLMLPAVMGLIAPALAGCVGTSGGSGGGDAIVVGTTDQIEATEASPAPLDPAAAYDTNIWNILRNTFQTLMVLPRTGTQPIPDAARSCGFTDQHGQIYSCSIRPGLEFSNGDPLTSADVKFSIERSLAINDPNGPSSLLSDVASIYTPDATTVSFYLRHPDATFPYKLTTPAAAIVDSNVYPQAKERPGYQITGSGPYTLNSLTPGGEAVFLRNPHYQGAETLNNNKIELKFFKDANSMEAALMNGSIDVMSRTMTPDQVAQLQASTARNQNQSVQLTQAPGTQIDYLVFNTNDSTVASQAVRQAIAQVVDREALVRDVYARTAQPLYSMVPQGITGHTNSFFDLYGAPNFVAAHSTLVRAGITTPVPITLTYTTDHYGSATAAEFAELKKQLEASGLFTVTIHGVPWATYRPSAVKGTYAIYGMGWFPDFPDPDNYIAPFFGNGNVVGSPYSDSTITDQLIPATRQDADRGSAVNDFQEIQNIIARDVPYLPLWQGQQYLASRSDISGTEWVLNSSCELQLWELGRGVTG